jgi:acetylornithine deacetylase/succinyl-diaminopimelate desuccinylase-like protein
MRNLICYFVILHILGTGFTFSSAQGKQVRELTAGEVVSSLGLFRELLSIPNDGHFPEQVERNLTWVSEAFQERGFSLQVLKTDGPPLLLAERSSKGASKTALIYLQIDGQPVDPSKWHQPDPYEPVLKEHRGDVWQEISWEELKGEIDPDWRVFARSASDAKGPVAMLLTALDTLRQSGLEATTNLKVIMDFEEELGSPHLPSAVGKYRDQLKSDFLLVLDGPRHLSNKPTLTFGARGIATITLTVFGPREPQHSGHYGNFIPNPALRLAQLLSTMKDGQGRVTIEGFYDDVVLDSETREMLAQTPDDEETILRNTGVADTDRVSDTYQESIQYPSLNIRGLGSGWIKEQVRTIIPSTATAEIDVRLVPEVDAERLVRLIRNHVKNQGYHLIPNREPTEQERREYPRITSFYYEVSYQAFRTPYDSTVGLWLTRALENAFGEPPVRIRMSGGSVPISPFVNQLKIPAVTVPTVNRDNNQHSPNENLRLGNYFEGVKTFLAILTEPL